MISWELCLSSIGIIISVLALYFSRKAQAIKEMKSLENRLTKLESNQMTSRERESLSQLEIKMNLFWGVVESEFPKLLVRKSTPQLDVLLLKAAEGEALDSTEATNLIDGLNKAYASAVEAQDSTRAKVIAFYKAVFVFNRNHNNSE